MSYEIATADLKKHEKDIKRFWQQNFPSWPIGKFDWFYQKNIYSKALCWLIREAKSSDVVGTTVLFPRNFFYKGKKVSAAITGDFGVNKKHRILGPALQLQKAVKVKSDDNTFDFLYGFPNKNSEPVQKRVGFKVVGQTVRMVKVLKSNLYLKKKLKLTILTGLIAPVFNLFLKLRSEERKVKIPKSFSSELVNEFDNRFDVLWQQALKNFTLIGIRDSRFLKWRFIDCPYINYNVFTLYDKDEKKLIGYIAFYKEENILYIADILAIDNQLNLEYLLASFFKQARQMKINALSLSFMGSKKIVEKFTTFNFIERADKRSVVAYTKENAKMKHDLFNSEKWYFFEADND